MHGANYQAPQQEATPVHHQNQYYAHMKQQAIQMKHKHFQELTRAVQQTGVISQTTNLLSDHEPAYHAAEVPAKNRVATKSKREALQTTKA